MLDALKLVVRSGVPEVRPEVIFIQPPAFTLQCISHVTGMNYVLNNVNIYNSCQDRKPKQSISSRVSLNYIWC